MNVWTLVQLKRLKLGSYADNRKKSVTIAFDYETSIEKLEIRFMGLRIGSSNDFSTFKTNNPKIFVTRLSLALFI